MPGQKTFEIHEALELLNNAKESEINKKFSNAASGYKATMNKFKESGQEAHYAKCVVGYYANMIKYYLEGRDIEGLSENLIEDYINRVVRDINEAKVQKFEKYDILISAYHEFEGIFAAANMKEKAEEMYYEKKKLYHRYYWTRITQGGRKWYLKIKDFFNSIINLIFFCFCGHGERPLWALSITLSIIILLSIIYCRYDLIMHASSGESLSGWPQALYFSIVTFTTLGFGDFVPKNSEGQTWVAFEVLMGYFMLGSLVAIIIRKISR